MKREKRMARIKEAATRNSARLSTCKLHNFDWKTACEREVKRRQESGVSTPISIGAYLMVRCKNCGGKMLVGYALSYMDAVNSVKKLNERERRAYFGEPEPATEKQLQKPLTLDEVREIALRVFKGEFSKHIVFVEGFLLGTNMSREFGYAEPYKRGDLDPGDPHQDTIQMYYPGSTESEDYDEKLYGIYWRCWRTRPTKEERAAAQWSAPKANQQRTENDTE